MNLRDKIRALEDYPAKGIIFRDITTLLKDKEGFREAINQLCALRNDEVDLIVGIEARGFIIGAPMAYNKNCGFVPIRKPGKLPSETVAKEYSLEYGTDMIEIHKDAIEEGMRVLIVDDLLATGGTSKAAIELVESLGGVVVGVDFLVELEDLPGRELLKGYDVKSVIKY